MKVRINPALKANRWEENSRSSAVVHSSVQRRGFARVFPGFSILRIPALAAVLMSPAVLWAQSGAEDNPGINSGDYNIHQTIEAGYRANFVNGNKDTYDTFENLGSGLRLFNYSLEMRSPERCDPFARPEK
jgi:hypothetical protein